MVGTLIPQKHKNHRKRMKKQNMIAVSSTVKTFVQDCTADFGGPSKSKEFMAASEREIADGLVKFVETNRYQTESDEEGNQIERDLFAEVMNQIITDRLGETRERVTVTAKLAAAEAKQAALIERLKALGVDVSDLV